VALTKYVRTPTPAIGDLRTFINSELAKIQTALDQLESITPTWLNLHKFKGGIQAISGARPAVDATQSVVSIGADANFAQIQLVCSSASVDTRRWDEYIDSAGQYHFRIDNDAGNASIDWMTVSRNATVGINFITWNTSTALIRTTATNFNPLVFMADGQASGVRGWGFRFGSSADLQIRCMDDNGNPTVVGGLAIDLGNVAGSCTSLTFGNTTSNPTFTFNGSAVTWTGLATTTVAPGAGGAGALPATPAGYVTMTINGTARKIPYY